MRRPFTPYEMEGLRRKNVVEILNDKSIAHFRTDAYQRKRSRHRYNGTRGGHRRMVTFFEAIETILSNVERMDPVSVPLLDSFNYTLAEDITSDVVLEY